MKYTEEVLVFSCVGDTLLGILTRPENPADIGIVLIVGGPQYRAGSHRQFVLLSRALAAAGYAVLRFDHRGMGDSEGIPRDFESVNADISAAIENLKKLEPTVTNVVLWGLCDGASAALLYYFESRDTKVSGLCLLNPWVRSESSLARTHVKHYYRQRLMQKDFWNKLLHGGVALKAASELVRNIHVATTGIVQSSLTRPAASQQPFQQRMAAAWNAFSGRILLLLSEHDYTAKEFLEFVAKNPVWKNALTHHRLVRHELPGANHTFSSEASNKLVVKLTLDWLDEVTP